MRVWAALEPALHEGGFHAFLLHGVTGSGKTEIYLRAIEEVVRQGKEALVLVPEISLTPQTIARFQGRCGEVAVLHSHLGDAERGGHWRRIAAGQVQVVVGARSAVFAPARKLGLIVIDEEHESTLQAGIDAALPRPRRGRDAGPAGEHPDPARLGHAVAGELAQRPARPVHAADAAAARARPAAAAGDADRPAPRASRAAAASAALSRGAGTGHARRAAATGGQVMLLLNRRGFSTHIHCPACGHVETCRFCDLALTYHQQRDVMLCHYCGYEQAPPQTCPQCGQAAVRYQGLGTEKLQAEIEETFPSYVVRRMDSDTMQRPGSHGRVLAAFRDGQIHILLGTQMIAKGLDFPNVTLVGVVNADIGLHMPDFRSAERTFQLLSQVAGRTGRGPRGGRVLVQTFTPDHPCIALAAAHDYAGFVDGGTGPSAGAQLPAVPAAGPGDRPQPRPAGGGRVRRAAGRRRSTTALKAMAAKAAGGGATAGPGRGAGVPAEGLLPLSLPAAIAEPGDAAPGAARGAADAAAADGGRVHAGCGSV